MHKNIKSFLDGYSKAIMLLPDFEENNLYQDWEIVGMDIEVSIKVYDKKNKMDKLCKRKITLPPVVKKMED
jgi:hypothetical protein